MKITDVRIRVVQPPDHVFGWRQDIPPMNMSMTLFEIDTDEQITGSAMSWLPASPHDLGETVHHFYRSLLLGADPFDRERLWHEMLSFTRYLIPSRAASHIDIALWDIAGKAADLPIYKLLGAYRETMPAYVTISSPDPSGHPEASLAAKAAGMRAVKLKATYPEADIEAAGLTRAAVGDGYPLMLDATSAYDFTDALRVGRALEKLDFHWFEDPMRNDDVGNYRRLTQALDIPVVMGEEPMSGPWGVANYLREGACDAIRGVGDAIGGITGLRKLGAMAEMHGCRMEPHSYGSTLVQAAHLHHMLASRNCEYFELPYPREKLDFGMLDTVEIVDGLVVPPTKPGLGYDLDRDAIEDATILIIA